MWSQHALLFGPFVESLKCSKLIVCYFESAQARCERVNECASHMCCIFVYACACCVVGKLQKTTRKAKATTDNRHSTHCQRTEQREREREKIQHPVKIVAAHWIPFYRISCAVVVVGAVAVADVVVIGSMLVCTMTITVCAAVCLATIEPKIQCVQQQGTWAIW